MKLKAMVFAVVFFAAASVASANSLTFVSGGSNQLGGVDVGPYTFTATINGVTSTLQLVCDEFEQEVSTGESWNVNLSTFPTLANVAHSGATTDYQEIAWLTQQMLMNLGNAETVGDIQWAIWDIFDPGVSSNDPRGTISSTDQTSINNWLSKAGTNAANGSYAGALIYTPIPGTQPATDSIPQEFVGVPEPAVLLLAAIGMCWLFAFRRRLAL